MGQKSVKSSVFSLLSRHYLYFINLPYIIPSNILKINGFLIYVNFALKIFHKFLPSYCSLPHRRYGKKSIYTLFNITKIEMQELLVSNVISPPYLLITFLIFFIPNP